MKILLLAGKKQSGKSTAGNFVVGYTMTQLARQGKPYLPKKFRINEESGDLTISSFKLNLDDEPEEASCVLDIYNKDPEYLRWAEDCLHPYIKPYAYADTLKAIAVNVFGIPYEFANGTEEDKKNFTHIKWQDMCALLPPRVVNHKKRAEKYDKKMTVREFLQFFGTNVCRKLFPECWLYSCFNRILSDEPEIAVITDGRFENEIKGAKKYRSKDVDVKIVKLERSPYIDSHESETGLEKMHNNNFDLIIPKDVTIKEKNQLILDAMYEWGWFEEHESLEE